jgi:NADP-dependent 3-hydroxy acid dehydrogenase YdfG
MLPLVADIRSDDDVAAVRAAVERDGGGIDALVHCAGSYAADTTAAADVADLDEQYRANLRGPYVLSQALLPLLCAGGGGDVVFVNSTAALGPRPGVGQFAATQAALRSVADALRAELNDSGVRVLTVFPGRTATARQERIHAVEGKHYDPERLMQADDVAGIVLAALDLPRRAEVTEIVLRPSAKPA